jgi:predicted dehydrogenase
MKTIRYAVVGCGGIANHYHLPALTAVPGTAFALACDLVQERAEGTAATFGAEDYCTDYRRVMADEGIDLVCLFTKVRAHAEIAIAAAEAGKHVFVQKPFAQTLAQGRAMIAAAERNGVHIAPSFMHRYFDESVAAAEIIDQGRLGRLEFIRQRNATRNPPETAPSFGGSLMDIGAHGIDLLRSLTGQRIVRVCAELHDPGFQPSEWTTLDPEQSLLGSEINAFLLYELADGATASHEVQWSARAGTSRFQTEVYGTEGTLYLRVPGTDAALSYASTADLPQGAKRTFTWTTPELPGRRMGLAQHEAVIESVRACAEGGDWTAQTGKEGMAVLAVCAAARQSAATGKWINVESL